MFYPKEFFPDIKAFNCIFSPRNRRVRLVAEKGTETESGVSAVGDGIKPRQARSEHRLLHSKEKSKLSDGEKSHQVLPGEIPLKSQFQCILCVPRSVLVFNCMVYLIQDTPSFC